MFKFNKNCSLCKLSSNQPQPNTELHIKINKEQSLVQENIDEFQNYLEISVISTAIILFIRLFTHLNMTKLKNQQLKKEIQKILKDKIIMTIIYFGSVQNSFCENDLIIYSSDEDLAKEYIGNHFYIRFDKEINQYFIKDMGAGFGCFMLIDSPFIINDDIMLNFGLTFLIIKLKPDKSLEIEMNQQTGNSKNLIINPSIEEFSIGKSNTKFIIEDDTAEN